MTSSHLAHAKQALEQLDTELVLSAYADDLEFEDIPSGESILDKQGLRVYFKRLFSFPNVAFSDIAVREVADFAVIEWAWSGTKRSSGDPYRVRGASIIELRGGKIRRERLYYDPRPALG
jgi:ketosteroid isomerase-like protein